MGYYDGLLAGRSARFSSNLSWNVIQMQVIPKHLALALKREGYSLFEGLHSYAHGLVQKQQQLLLGMLED